VAMSREQEREIGLAFSETLRESYQASRFREGVEWLEEGKPEARESEEDASNPDEAA
jgi:hypothetical protein